MREQRKRFVTGLEGVADGGLLEILLHREPAGGAHVLSKPTLRFEFCEGEASFLNLLVTTLGPAGFIRSHARKVVTVALRGTDSASSLPRPFSAVKHFR